MDTSPTLCPIRPRPSENRITPPNHPVLRASGAKKLRPEALAETSGRTEWGTSQ